MKNEYALKQEHLVHISDVERGLKCNCTCPGCGENVIARKGLKNIHHFAHQGAECSHGIETTLHLMAKNILEQEKQILLPEVTISIMSIKGHISSPQMIKFDEVFIEKRHNELVPDILIRAGQKKLIIEIYVTNKIDEVKHKKIVDLGLSTLIIDLSKFDRMMSIEELRKIIIEETDCKHWIYNQKATDYKQKWLSVCEVKQVTQEDFVKSCPIRIRDEFYVHDVWVYNCIKCQYMINAIPKHDGFGFQTIYCCANANIKNDKKLESYLYDRESFFAGMGEWDLWKYIYITIFPNKKPKKEELKMEYRLHMLYPQSYKTDKKLK